MCNIPQEFAFVLNHSLELVARRSIVSNDLRDSIHFFKKSAHKICARRIPTCVFSSWDATRNSCEGPFKQTKSALTAWLSFRRRILSTVAMKWVFHCTQLAYEIEGKRFCWKVSLLKLRLWLSFVLRPNACMATSEKLPLLNSNYNATGDWMLQVYSIAPKSMITGNEYRTKEKPTKARHLRKGRFRGRRNFPNDRTESERFSFGE